MITLRPMLKAMVQEILNIEQYCQRKFYKIKTNFFKRNWGTFLMLCDEFRIGPTT